MTCPHPFFIHDRTSDIWGVAPSTPFLLRRYYSLVKSLSFGHNTLLISLAWLSNWQPCVIRLGKYKQCLSTFEKRSLNYNLHDIKYCQSWRSWLLDCILLTGCQKYVADFTRDPTPSSGESPRRGNSFKCVVDMLPATPLQMQLTTSRTSTHWNSARLYQGTSYRCCDTDSDPWPWSPPKFKHLFTGTLPTFPENFMRIRSEVFAKSC